MIMKFLPKRGEIIMYLLTHNPESPTPWNKGKLLRQKAPLKLRDIWSVRIRLQMNNRLRALALFNLVIDSKPGPAIW